MAKQKKNGNGDTGANLGFEQKLWQAVDALRNNMDAQVAEQFGKFIKPNFARASSASQEVRVLAALRDILLPKLISGELGVKDAGCFMDCTV
ncbi:MAG: hypothetical protein M0024_12505 [Nitrospiraceae bacterium]|nr:hypothetical protein [Nitrospiraceae bacterium]